MEVVPLCPEQLSQITTPKHTRVAWAFQMDQCFKCGRNFGEVTFHFGRQIQQYYWITTRLLFGCWIFSNVKYWRGFTTKKKPTKQKNPKSNTWTSSHLLQCRALTETLERIKETATLSWLSLPYICSWKHRNPLAWTSSFPDASKHPCAVELEPQGSMIAVYLVTITSVQFVSMMPVRTGMSCNQFSCIPC